MSLVVETPRPTPLVVRREVPRDERNHFVPDPDKIGRLEDLAVGDIIPVHGRRLRIPPDPLRDVVELTATHAEHVWSWCGTDYEHGTWVLRWPALWVAAQLQHSTLYPITWRPHRGGDPIT